MTTDREPDRDEAHQDRLNAPALTAMLADHTTWVDDAPDLVALARTLADAVDADHYRFCPSCKRGALTASLSTVYLKTLLELRGIDGGDEDGADDLASRMSAAVVDPKD